MKIETKEKIFFDFNNEIWKIFFYLISKIKKIFYKNF